MEKTLNTTALFRALHIPRFQSSPHAVLLPLCETLQLTEPDIENLVKRCNEQAIYDLFFRSKFEGRPYHLNDAQEFINLANSGWQAGTDFIYLLFIEPCEPIGCVAIKFHESLGNTIGYWVSESHPGYMTNCVNGACSMAGHAGIRLLHAEVRHTNTRSIRVLERAGFVSTEIFSRGPEYVVYKKIL